MTINTMNEWNEAFGMLNKLDVVIENAYDLYETETLLLEATGEDPDKNSKLKAAGAVISAGAAKFIEWAKALIDKLMSTVGTFIRGGDKAVWKEDCELSRYIYGGIPPYIKQLMQSAHKSYVDYRQADKFANDVNNVKTKYKAGTPADIRKIYNQLNGTKEFLRKIDRMIKSEPDIEKSIHQTYRVYIKDLINETKKALSNIVPEKKFNKNRGDSTMNDSVNYSSMTRNEYIANIMLEAAELLKDDVVKDDTEVVEFDDIPEEKPIEQDEYNTATVGGDDEDPELDEIKDLCGGDQDVIDLLTDDEDKSVTVDSDGDNSTNEAALLAIREAIDVFYDKAALCEDVEEATEYIEKAQELQKAIDDIPEEKPVEQDEYNTATVGGDDEDPELEEIKDLCGNDQDVIDLLTDDEDKSVTVDSDGDNSTNEAIDFFSLSF